MERLARWKPLCRRAPAGLASPEPDAAARIFVGAVEIVLISNNETIRREDLLILISTLVFAVSSIIRTQCCIQPAVLCCHWIPA